MGFFGWGRGGAISSANFEGVWEGREGASFAGGLGSVGPHILTKKAPVLLEVFLPPLQEDAGAGKKNRRHGWLSLLWGGGERATYFLPPMRSAKTLPHIKHG